jgi:hypothetical protein
MWPWRCPVYRWRELVAGAGVEQENLSSRDGDQSRDWIPLLAAERENPEWGRVPIRGTGADRLVVAVKVL